MSEGAFLAEASVLIQANTKLFRDELAAALATVPKAIEIPVVAVGGTGKLAASAEATAASLNVQKNAAEDAGVASQRLTTTQQSAVRANDLLAASTQRLALGEKNAVAAANDVGAAQARYRAQVASTTLVERAQREAIAATDPVLIEKADAALLAAKNDERAALAALENARAQKILARDTAAAAGAQAARTGEVTKGLQAQALSAAGLRGAIIGANPAFLAATAGAILFGKAVQSAVSLETQLNVFRVTVGATADEMNRAGQIAQQLGRDVSLPGVSAGDAAQAFTELGKAGLSVQDSFAGARGVLQLATAAQIDNAQATELAASALNAFGLSGDQAVHVADVLANAANDAQGSISDMGIALQQASAAGRQAGLSLEDTAGILTVFARNGIKGSDAGTLLRTLLIRLINPTDKAAKVIKDLGLNLRDASGNIDLSVFQQFANATRNLTPAQRDQSAAIIAGQDAFRGLSILAREGSSALDAQVASLNTAGTAAEVAAAQNAGLAGEMANLKNQLDTAGIAIGQLTIGPLSALVEGFSIAVGEVDTFIRTLKRIPGSIPIPKIDVGPVDTEKQGEEAGNLFIGGLKAGAAFGAKSLLSGGPTGALGITLLERLFPPDKVADAGANAGANIRSAIEDASREAVQAAASAEAQITGALNKAFFVIRETLENGIKKQQTAAARGVAQGANQQSGLEDAMNQILLGGGSPQEQIAGFQKQFKTQQAIIDKATAGLTGLTSGDKFFGTLTKAVRAARAKQVQINGQIKSIQQGVTADQEAAANQAEQDAKDAQTARDKRDQAILDSFGGGQNRIGLAQARAGDSIAAQEAVQVLIANTASAEIGAIEKSVKNVKTRNAEIAKRVQILVTAGAELDRLQKQADDALTQKRADAFQAQVDLAQAEGNIPLQIRFNNLRIRAIDKLIASGKQVGAALNRLKAERATKQQENEDLQNQQIQDRIALGQSIEDLTGNKNPLLQALNAAIAETRHDIAAAKAAGKSTVVFQTELNNFLKQRKDVLEKATDEVKGQGTTAFDLLKEANDTFNKNAGNLIGGNQPFAGPTGFTADIAQFLIRRQQQPAGVASTATKTPVPPIGLQDQPLIQAIEKLTGVIIETANGGNASTAGPVAHGTKQSRVWHSENLMARRYQEA